MPACTGDGGAGPLGGAVVVEVTKVVLVDVVEVGFAVVVGGVGNEGGVPTQPTQYSCPSTKEREQSTPGFMARNKASEICQSAAMVAHVSAVVAGHVKSHSRRWRRRASADSASIVTVKRWTMYMMKGYPQGQY